MRPYAQYCPIARSIEVLGDRWTLLILRDMLIGRRHFNELSRGLPGISRTLLSQRLRQLAADGLIERTDDGYVLTQAGEDLRPLVFALAEWGARYAFGEPRPEELDPDLLMWWMHNRVEASDVTQRVVVQIEISDGNRMYWLVVEPQDASVCHVDPGFEVDAVLRSDLATLYKVWLRDIELLDAVRAGTVELHGPRWLVRALPRWLQFSPVAPYVQAARVG